MKILVELNPVSYVINASITILNAGFWPTSAWIVLGAGIVIISIFAPLTVLVYKRK
jgi:ABC-2 type transport system permease protein